MWAGITVGRDEMGKRYLLVSAFGDGMQEEHKESAHHRPRDRI